MSSKIAGRLRIRNAAQLVVVARGKPFLRGAEMRTVEVIVNGSLAVDDNGDITHVGTTSEVLQATAEVSYATDIDASGKCVLPGFVDCHTHPVWSGDRCHEFIIKLNGATYLDVQKMGGGIGFTTRHTKASSEDELLALLRARLRRMAQLGTTTIEGKSGYGLEKDTEMKMLRVLHRAQQEGPIDIVSTFLGAHSVPTGMTSDEATDAVIRMIPELQQQKAEGRMNPENIDVFCETGVFSVDQSRKILLAGKAAGLGINFHGEELSYLGSGELAGEIGARAVSHLEHVSDAGIVAMAAADSFAVLLPATAYVLRIAQPPARRIIDGGVPVALGSDFCPNAHNLSMPFTMNLACVAMKMTCEEALIASTLNAAASIHRERHCGSLEVGKWGDVVLLNAASWEHVIYEMVDPPIEAVFKKGLRIA